MRPGSGTDTGARCDAGIEGPQGHGKPGPTQSPHWTGHDSRGPHLRTVTRSVRSAWVLDSTGRCLVGCCVSAPDHPDEADVFVRGRTPSGQPDPTFGAGMGRGDRPYRPRPRRRTRWAGDRIGVGVGVGAASPLVGTGVCSGPSSRSHRRVAGHVVQPGRSRGHVHPPAVARAARLRDRGVERTGSGHVGGNVGGWTPLGRSGGADTAASIGDVWVLDGAAGPPPRPCR